MVKHPNITTGNIRSLQLSGKSLEISFAQSDDDDEGIKLDQLRCGSNEAPEWLGLMIGRAPRSHAPLKPARQSSRPVKANVLNGSDLGVN